MASEGESDVKGELDDSGCIQDEVYNSCLKLMDLPDDVLLYILQCCSARDLKALGYSCTRLCRLVQERRLWRRVDARGERCSAARLRWLLDNVLHDGTRQLLLHGYAQDVEGCLGYMNVSREEGERANCADINWERVDRFAQHLRAARERMFKSKCPGLAAWSDGCSGRGGPHGCAGPQFSLSTELLADLAATCPNLTTLHLEYCNIDCKLTSLDHFPTTLRELSLRGTKCFNMLIWDKTFLFKINTHLPNLEVVDVSECAWMEPATLLPLSKLPVLAELRLRDCVKLTEFVAYASITARYGFRALKSLDLRGSPVGDSEISALGWLPRLERLWLAHEHRPAPAAAAARRSLTQHAHYSDDPVTVHRQLHPWEEQELFPDREAVKRKPEEETSDDGSSPKRQRTDNTSDAFSGLMGCIGITFRMDRGGREAPGAGGGGGGGLAGYVRYRRNGEPVAYPPGPGGGPAPGPGAGAGARSRAHPDEGASTSRERAAPREEVEYLVEPRHHVLYVNVGPQVSTYRFPRAVPDVSELFSTPRHVDAAALVTDFAIRRFGRADGADVNVINIGPEAGPTRPDRSSLRYLSLRGYRHVTDRSLLHLAAAAPLLQHADLSGTGVTRAGAERFRALRPDCTLVYTHATTDADENVC